MFCSFYEICSGNKGESARVAAAVRELPATPPSSARIRIGPKASQPMGWAENHLSMRYWGYFAAKLGVVAAVLYGMLIWLGWMWPSNPARLAARAATRWESGAALQSGVHGMFSYRRRGAIRGGLGSALPLPRVPSEVADADPDRVLGPHVAVWAAADRIYLFVRTWNIEGRRIADLRHGEPRMDAAFGRFLGRALRLQQGIGPEVVNHLPRWRIAAGVAVLAALLGFVALFRRSTSATSNCRITCRA